MIYTATNGSRWNVHYEALPIPDRSHDWQATHSNYDGAPDAGDAKRLHVEAATRSELIERIEGRCACGLEREECDCQ